MKYTTLESNKRLNFKTLLIFSIFIASITTFLRYFPYGTDNHISELPLVLRAIDSNYLTGDFYTNVASEYGPRYYYSHLIGSMASKKSLPILFFVMVLLINISIALITFYFSRYLFKGSLLTGILAVVLVMSIKTFRMGGAPYIYVKQLISSNLVVPFALLSIVTGIKGNYVWWALVSGMAVFIHPSFGFEAGIIGFFLLLFSRARQFNKTLIEYLREKIFKITFFLVVFLGFFLFHFIPYLSTIKVSPNQFIQLETFFRHPHHNIFDHVAGIDNILFFLIAIMIAWFLNREEWNYSDHQIKLILWLFVFLILLGFCSFFLLNIIPFRWLGILRPLRLFFFLKWIGLILIAGNIVHFFQKKSKNFSQLDALSLIISLLSPITLAFNQLVNLIRFKFDLKKDKNKKYLFSFFTIGLVVGFLFFFRSLNLNALLLYLLFITLVLFILYGLKPWIFKMVQVSLMGIMVFSFFSPQLISIKPKIFLKDLSGLDIEVSCFARKNSPENSIFLAPLKLGIFRIVAERPIVVNWRSFPFQDSAMIEWKNRIDNCYGTTGLIGREARDFLNQSYKKIDDAKILELQSLYGFSYVILFKETPTQFPVLFENSKFKIISLRNLIKRSFLLK
jgi:hypothetical protein